MGWWCIEPDTGMGADDDPPTNPIQAIHSLIASLHDAAEALPPAHKIEGGGIDPDAGSDPEPFTWKIEAAAGDTDTEAGPEGLAGIVWASGTHDLWVNGEPTRVHVPADTIPETFERLQARMSGEEPVLIGFDHPEDDSVAATTALGEIGVATDFTMDAEDGRTAITMRESEFTNSKAVEAAEADAFSDVGFSIVGNIALQTDADGNPLQEDGALQVAATDIQRVDVVLDQAVDGATNGNLPALADAARAAGRLAASNPRQNPEGLVRTLRAAAGSIETGIDPDAGAGANHQNQNMDDAFPTDPENLEAARSALTQASETVEAKQEQIEDLEADVSSLETEADHFRQIAASQGVDPDAEDFEPQAVVDAFSEDLRAEIADLEAALPKYDTESIEERASGLAGKSLSELEAMAGKRWREFGQSKSRRDELSVAVAATESVGTVEGANGEGSEAADDAASDYLTAREQMQARDAGQTPSEYVEAKHGVSPTEYSTGHELQAKIGGEN